jgi:general secretion pathway protein H
MPVRGFTLIEILVVMVLIGIIISFAVLSIGSAGEREAEQEARRFAALVDLASEEAVLKSTEMGILFQPDGYRFLAMGADDAWQPLEDDVFRLRRLPPGMALTLAVEGLPVTLEKPSEKPLPQVFLLSSGERTPFEIGVAIPDGRRFQVAVPAIGDAVVMGLEERLATR